MNIAWIGTGVMGAAMLQHLQQAGHVLHIFNRSYAKAAALARDGIIVHKELAACVREAEVVITMVGYPKDVEEIYTGKDGIFAHAKRGCILIDMTTSSPSLARNLARQATELGFSMLDAPVSGGDSGAKAATLSIMCGGERAVFDRAVPLLSLMGSSLHYIGEAGSGQHCKACNQIAVAGAVAAMSEAIVYARTNGVDPEVMLNAISGGAAGSWQINNTAPRVLKEDFAPGFYIKHFIKDMHIVQDAMKEQGVSLDMLDQVCRMYEKLADEGEENNGTQALLHYYTNRK